MNKKKKVGKPLTRGGIFKLMVTLTYLVSGAFVVKNLLGGDMQGTMVIGGVLVAFTAVLLGMIALKVKYDIQRLVVSASIIVLVFIIGLTTGTYYSEDFCLYLAVIGLTGLYLKPTYAWVQLVLADIFLAIQFVVHPEKADPLGQFIMCMVTFTLAGVLFTLVIGRGRAFIESAQQRTEEAESLLTAMKTIGLELEENFKDSNKRIDTLTSANEAMRDSAEILQRGSESISSDAYEVSTSCDSVQFSMQETEQSIQNLNNEIHTFEEVMDVNRRNMAEMNDQMSVVKRAMDETTRVFRVLDEQMQQIATVTEEINKIASNTGLLAVNASIEAARAGTAGKGFAVVATNVRELAVSSTQCSNEVADVVSTMKNQIDTTSRQLTDSTEAVAATLQTLSSFQQGCNEMMDQFTSIYGNIETQTETIGRVSGIFSSLKDRASTMSANSEENQQSVESIAGTMRLYRENIAAVIEDNRRIQTLSENMLSIAQSTNYDKVLD